MFPWIRKNNNNGWRKLEKDVLLFKYLQQKARKKRSLRHHSIAQQKSFCVDIPMSKPNSRL
jgi:hypothetical protein